jgi:hypothetical protein
MIYCPQATLGSRSLQVDIYKKWPDFYLRTDSLPARPVVPETTCKFQSDSYQVGEACPHQ